MSPESNPVDIERRRICIENVERNQGTISINSGETPETQAAEKLWFDAYLEDLGKWEKFTKGLRFLPTKLEEPQSKFVFSEAKKAALAPKSFGRPAKWEAAILFQTEELDKRVNTDNLNEVLKNVEKWRDVKKSIALVKELL